MHILAIILATIVAVEHLYIMYLETIATTSKKTSETFNIEEKELQTKTIGTLLKNQGVYNGLLAVAILYGLYISANPFELVVLLLTFVFLVALYGGFTSSKSIIVKQGLPAFLALLAFIFFY